MHFQKLLKLALIILSFFISITSYGQWRKIPEFGIYCNNAILDEDNMIWGVGSGSKTFRYDPSSKQFDFYQLNEDFDILSLFALDSSTLFLGGRDWAKSNGFVLSYDPIGDSVKHFQNTNYDIRDILFTNQDTGYVVGFEGVQRTINGGISWEIVWEFNSIGAEYGELYSIISDSSGAIYASGIKRQNLEGSNFQGLLIKSKSHGDTWDIVFEPSEGYLVNLEYRHDKIYCHDQEVPKIYISPDLGDTWNTIEIPIDDPTLQINDVTFLSEDHILACIPQNIIFFDNRWEYVVNIIVDSPDGGVTWYTQFENHPPYPPGDTLLRSLVNVNDTIVYCFGWNLALVTENKGGNTNPIMGISNSHHNSKLRLFPNPASETLFVEGLTDIVRYQIVSLTGIVVQSGAINSDQEINIPIDAIEPSVYILSLFSKTRFTHSKLFVKF